MYLLFTLLDKSYITHSEWSHLFGGSQATASSQSSGRVASFRRLPFNHCALTLTPFKTPVCTKEGIIFDKESIMKYIKDLQDRQLPLKNPVTNSALALTDLIPLHFESTGVHDEYRCPITKKIFNSNSHIVAIKNSGNVYLYEAIQKLCFETRNYFDLLNPDISFNKALVENGGHIIIIQDPSKLHAIGMNTSGLMRDPSRNVAVKAPPGPASSGIMKRVMSDLRQKECQIDEKSRRLGLTSQDATYIYHNKIVDHPSANLRVSGPAVIAGDDKNQQKLSVLYNSRTTISSQMSEGRVAASFTCSSFSPVTKNQLHKESELVQQIRKIKENAYISIKTSLGLLNFELFTRHAPRTVCNFIQLAKTGAYDNTIFHRNIPGFMVAIY